MMSIQWGENGFNATKIMLCVKGPVAQEDKSQTVMPKVAGSNPSIDSRPIPDVSLSLWIKATRIKVKITIIK